MTGLIRTPEETAIIQSILDDVIGHGVRLAPGPARQRLKRAGIITSAPPNRGRAFSVGGHKYFRTLTPSGRSVARCAGMAPAEAPRRIIDTREVVDDPRGVTVTRPQDGR